MIAVRAAGNEVRVLAAALGIALGAAIGEAIVPEGGGLPGSIVGGVGLPLALEPYVKRAENYALSKRGIAYGY